MRWRILECLCTLSGHRLGQYGWFSDLMWWAFHPLRLK